MLNKMNRMVLAIAVAIGGASAEAAKKANIFYPDQEIAINKVTSDPFLFLKENKKQLNIKGNLSDLVFVRARESLTATHHHFKQTLNGIDVHLGEVIVSVSDSGKIQRVFNNTYQPLQNTSSAKAALTANSALENAWDYLQVTGRLSAMPTSKLVYAKINGALELVYRTQINVEAPRGTWEQFVSAKTGEVISTTRIDLPLKVSANEGKENGQWQRFPLNKKAIALSNAISSLNIYLAKTTSKSSQKATGSAVIFDPNPVITLRNDALRDSNPATDFDAAYSTKTLMDITLDGANYKLEGPWVKILEFSDPVTAPSTTTDGNWTAKRGDNSFNDANTYYHIDTNQRYIQSLGFTGSKGIQEVAISVDTDGAGGADNSFYSSGDNQLVFGHGCVDDNEDTDVILHEYGHAINYSINTNWRGGDTGGMGEGFGDYWAGSYRQSTPNGDYHAEWVFSWDGHNNCWAGRVMNQTGYSYDPSQTYDDHQRVNGELSDELWSTPLFQSLLELVKQGQTREEVDTIILEAQFGLGANLRMPDMAQSIVDAAKRLYPSGPHADVFQEKFEQVKILTDPNANQAPTAAVAQSSITVTEGATVTLDASSSSDADGDTLTYSWAQTSGTAVTLSSTTAAAPTFTAPDVNPTSSLGFEVTVSDGTDSAKATVSVTVNNSATTPPPTTGGGGGGGGSAGLSLLGLLLLMGARRRKQAK